MTHIEKATDFLMQEFHCSQALAGAFAEEFGYNLKIRSVNKQNRFRKDVHDLLLSSSKKIGFIQFDVRRFKIINDLYGE